MCTCLKEIDYSRACAVVDKRHFQVSSIGCVVIVTINIFKGSSCDTQNYIEKFTESEGGARARAVGAGRSTAFCPEDSQCDELCTGKHQSARMAPSIIDIISKKRDGHELTRDEIEAFVRMVIDGTAQDCQIGMLACFL
jgi:Glycosyl transferase family, helical bundle domain